MSEAKNSGKCPWRHTLHPASSPPQASMPPLVLGSGCLLGRGPNNQTSFGKTEQTAANGMTHAKPRVRFPGALTEKGLDLGETWMCVPFQPLVDSGLRHTFHCSGLWSTHPQTSCLPDSPGRWASEFKANPREGRTGSNTNTRRLSSCLLQRSCKGASSAQQLSEQAHRKTRPAAHACSGSTLQAQQLHPVPTVQAQRAQL